MTILIIQAEVMIEVMKMAILTATWIMMTIKTMIAVIVVTVVSAMISLMFNSKTIPL